MLVREQGIGGGLRKGCDCLAVQHMCIKHCSLPLSSSLFLSFSLHKDTVRRLTDAASLLNGRGKCNIGNRFSHTHTHIELLRSSRKRQETKQEVYLCVSKVTRGRERIWEGRAQKNRVVKFVTYKFYFPFFPRTYVCVCGFCGSHNKKGSGRKGRGDSE